MSSSVDNGAWCCGLTRPEHTDDVHCRAGSHLVTCHDFGIAISEGEQREVGASKNLEQPSWCAGVVETWCVRCTIAGA